MYILDSLLCRFRGIYRRPFCSRAVPMGILNMCWSRTVYQLFPWFLCGTLFVLLETNHGLFARNHGGLYFNHMFMYICLFLTFTLSKSQSVADRREFLKPETMYTVMAWRFPFRFFFSAFFRAIPRVLSPQSACNSFVLVIIHLAFLLCSFRTYIWLQNCFVSFASGCCGAFSS